MSELERESHAKKWGVPLEEVAGRTAGHLVDPPHFTAVELLANIKRGTEVVLGGVASMPDVLQKIRDLRIEQSRIIDVEKTIVADYARATANGISMDDLKEWDRWRGEQLAECHRKFKDTRIELSRFMVGSLVNHVMLETAAVDGERSKQVVEVNKAMVLRDENAFDKMFPEKKHRSLLHPLGEKK